MADWELLLRRWLDAGLLDRETAAGIRAWEAARSPVPATRWSARLALGLGGLMLAAGILLFVAAHWEALSPGRRFVLVLALVGGLHLAGAAASARSGALAATLHACGTVALGAGIFLSAQIFHLQEHWPGGLMLWSAGAWAGWALLRQWPQGASAALLTPAWLTGEWITAADHGRAGVVGVGLVLLSLAYLAAGPASGPIRVPGGFRRALGWIGGLALIPSCVYLLLSSEWSYQPPGLGPIPLRALAWTLALILPAGVAVLLRGREALALVPAAVWAALGPVLAGQRGVMPYLWAGGLAILVIGSGLRDRRAERINLGMAGFALAVTVFYFSSVMDRLGRSASLIGLGLLFLGGGYLLDRARRRLLTRVREATG